MQNCNSTQCKNVIKNSVSNVASNIASKCALNSASNSVKFLAKNISKTAAFLLLFGSLNSAIAADNPLKKDWDIINYNPSTAYTGNGIILGVIDSGFPHADDVESLKGQMKGFNGNNNIDSITQTKAETMMHGAQVSGVILAKKIDSEKPYGMAYDSKFYGITFLNPTYNYDSSNNAVYNYYKNKDIKIVNNSWSSDLYPNINMQKTNHTIFEKNFQPLFNNDKVVIRIKDQNQNNDIIDGETFNSIMDYVDKKGPVLKDLMKLSKEGTLMVFASGNDGLAGPSLDASLPTYDESLRGWLVVGAIDSEKTTKTADGFELQSQKPTVNNPSEEKNLKYLHSEYLKGGLTPFTNSFKGSVSYSLLAPGYRISVVNPYYNDTDRTQYWSKSGYWEEKICDAKEQFCKQTGTSFSAPMVSAAAALVAQKYPFLNGAQLADVLLSTANNNVKVPEIVIKTSRSDYFDDKSQQYYYYDLIYVDRKVAPSKDEAKQDLINKMGFTDIQAQHILDHLYTKEITLMTKEELIGQGILDVEKALGGLAKLDANRLNKENIETRENGERQAIYTINTNNHDADFSNNISQEIWKKDWHNTKADNYPAEMENIKKVGLKKLGSGVLTLSGDNNYQGDTIVQSGTLKLSKGSKSDGGKLSNSNVFAENSGIFLFSDGEVENSATAQNGGFISIESSGNKVGKLIAQNLGTISFKDKMAQIAATNGVEIKNGGILQGAGTISGSVVNSGLVKAGFSNTSDSIDSSSKLTLSNKYTQEQSGELQFLFTKNANSQLTAQSYTINGGKLVYVPIQNASTLITNGDKITISIDSKLENALNSSQISVKNENNILEFSLGSDKKTITAKQKQGAFTPGGSSSSGSQGSSQSGSSQGSSQVNPQGSGSSGAQTPSSSQGGNSQGGSTSSGGSQGGNSQAQTGSSQGGGSSSSGQNSNPVITPSFPILPSMPSASSAPSAPNLSAQNSTNMIAEALSGMFARKISENYNAAFAELDTMPRGSYEKAIESLHEIPHNSGIVGVDSTQKALSVKSTLFVLNPSELAFAPTAALGGDYIEPSYTSYARTQTSAGLTYRRTNASNFKQDSYLLDLQAKKPIGDDSMLNGFVGAAYEKSTKDSSEIKSNIFSIGVGGARDLKSYGILGSVSAGFSNNKLNQNIANLGNTSTSADYNSYFFHAQGGVYVPFWLGEFGERTNTKLSPIAMLDFTSIYQNSFTQSGGLFAKKFDKSNFNNFRSWLGLNLSHIRDLEGGAKFAGNIFGFYWHNFNKPKDQNMSFADASDLHFSSSTDIGQDGVYFGVAGKVSWDRFFIHSSVGGELASKYNQIELMLRFGFEL